jgi:predicted dehydrogenase
MESGRGLMPQDLRIGVLGCARVVPYALVAPARQTPGVEVEAIASRSLDKARTVAAALGVPRAHGSYESLLDDTGVDAVYVALPPAQHAEWVRRAIDAGKHVLCEKPLALHAEEAADLAALASRAGRVLLEGMHLRYLSRLERQRAVVASGELGALQRVVSCFRLPRVPMAPGDFRLDPALGGGAALDIGCYAVSCLRAVAGEEPAVTASSCRRLASGVDRWMRAHVRFPSRASGVVECGFRGVYLPRMRVDAYCAEGTVTWDKAGIVIRTRRGIRKESTVPDWTYQRQLDAFVRACRGDASDAVPLADSIATARVVDAMRIQAGVLAQETVAV